MPTSLLPALPPQIFEGYGVSDRASRYVATHSNRAGRTGVTGVAFTTPIFGRYRKLRVLSRVYNMEIKFLSKGHST